jgi:carbamate kinase
VPRLIVAALGGNAIERSGTKGTADQQRRNLRKASEKLAALVADGNRLVVTHGNGPQVGQLLIQQERGAAEVPPMPLDVLVAETQGWLGYLLAEALDRQFEKRGLDERCAAVLMRTLVDPNDPAFLAPTKPVGPFFPLAEGRKVAKQRGWKMKEVTQASGKKALRRVVPSPRPLALLDVSPVRALLAQGLVPITVGGGGVPVARGKDGALHGVEGVIDKDLASALLAAELKADRFLILTDVEKVASRFGSGDQADIDTMTAHEARQWMAEKQFPAGSMKTKVEGALMFVEHGGREAVICHLDSLADALQGRTGTRIIADRDQAPKRP